MSRFVMYLPSALILRSDEIMLTTIVKCVYLLLYIFLCVHLKARLSLALDLFCCYEILMVLTDAICVIV